MDKIDKKIIETLRKNSRTPLTKIAERVGNVIVDAAKIINNLTEVKTKNHPDIGKGFLSVNKISGGDKYLSIPEECRFRIDWSSTIGETRDYVLKELRRFVNTLNLDFEVEFNWMERPTPFCESCITDQESKIIRISEKVFNHHNIPIIKTILPSTFDMSITCGLCKIPSVNIGPVGRNIHSNDEFVHTDSIIKCHDIIKDVVLDFLNS
jgi:succinyl-diaminopimelate desuccinylase